MLENTENIGFARANNQGVALAKGEFICVLNPDTVVAKETFTTLLHSVAVHKETGITGVKLVNGSGDFLPESKRNIPTPLVSLGRFTGAAFTFFKPYYANHITTNGNGKVSVLVGAFMFCNRKKFLDVGGFDEDYFMYGEDIDLSYKFLKAGFQNYYLGEISCIHYKGESTIRNKQYYQRFYGAMKIFYKKHFSKSIITATIVIAAIHLLSIVKGFTKNKTGKTEPGKYYLITKNTKLLEDLKQVLKVAVEIQDEVGVATCIKEPVEIIFDQESISFTNIISTIQQNSSNLVTYKIRPKGCSYLLGSNTSTGRGEVIQF